MPPASATARASRHSLRVPSVTAISVAALSSPSPTTAVFGTTQNSQKTGVLTPLSPSSQTCCSLAVTTTSTPTGEDALFSDGCGGQQSELKADKRRLAIRLRDIRLAPEKGKEEVDTASLHDLSLEAVRVRRILALELLAVYALQPVEAPLADPFLPLPQGSILRAPSSSPSSSSPFDPSPLIPFPPCYTLAALPPPPLSALLTVRQPQLEAVLLHLVHLTRLLALYEGVRLPFAPMPSCFGPGRAGVRATPGRGLAGGEDGKEAKRKGLSPDCWPVCFGSKRPSTTADEGGDDAADETEALEKARSRSGAAEGASRKDCKRTMAVLVGAAALAFDLAYVAWIREGRTAEPGAAPRAISDEELDDSGALIAGPSILSLSLPFFQRRDPHPPPSAFPNDFASVVRRYTASALSSPGKKSRSTLGDSAGSFIDADEAEEEWDFV
ncbi:hypothetical protein JCM5296_002215 [Sporobolomyces johnsonii]